jgi:hypothetical protein
VSSSDRDPQQFSAQMDRGGRGFHRRFVIGKDAPFRDPSAMDHGLPGRRYLPGRAVDGAARFAGGQHHIAIREQRPDLNPVIGTHGEVAAPSRLHRWPAFDAIAQRVHEKMVVGHKRGESIRIMAVDRGDKPVEDLGKAHDLCS